MNLPDFLTEPDPGEIRLTGHRIGLYSVMRVYNEGRTPEEIVEEFPTLSVEQVRRVIAFASENRTEVDRYVEDYRRKLEQQATVGKRVDIAKLRARFAELYPGKPIPGSDG